MFVIVLILSTTLKLSLSYSKQMSYSYCVPIKMNLDPRHEIKDGKELAHLILLTRSLLSSDEDYGILEAHHFSPAGTTFTGRIKKDLKWSDGTLVTAKEIAKQFIEILPYRSIGKRVSVDKKRPFTISAQREFTIHFKSDVKNLTGIIKEAITSNSRQNRFWFVKAKGGEVKAILSKYSVNFNKGIPNILFGNFRILLSEKIKCDHADLTVFPDLNIDYESNFSLQQGILGNQLTWFNNTKKFNIDQRMAITNWIQDAIKDLPPYLSVLKINSFFISGETGFRSESKFSYPTDQSKLPPSLKIAVEVPVYKKIIQAAAKGGKMKVEFAELPVAGDAIDGQLLSSTIPDGRQLILQDYLSWNGAMDMLVNAPKTVEALKLISKESSATIPPKDETLYALEDAAIEEISMVPILRRFSAVASRKSIPIEIYFSRAGELRLRERNNGL